ncbi:hypothetical protein M436DRAFT_64146 [Aureobasidium namibiae CBS 147.97]|uniref:Zn(2)-C6 fungal-type domain-containing protein n=1 Tax=Aureobasidium namibiae CBS 147.97 TaxID=1043004 RepID=A0A074WT97_9PEZI|nr:uncharacterized protein M436DRAFT_64146 [Aureobasidium namibiae CBS 147.97]KEQ72982.1 hypothetical protein M436DRAFT_64146 [Aureobasidium namibiae CBS 147.97]
MEVKAKRRRIAGAKYSKNACGTCRIRRVKCDEARPDCKNCVSTGRTCDGYVSSTTANSNKTLPRKLLPAATTLLPITIARSPSNLAFSTTSEDQMSFQYFNHHIVSGLKLIFSNYAWITLSLQLASTEPCIYFAIAACGSVGSARLARKHHCYFTPPSPVQEKRNLKQYCKAAAALQKYIDFAACGKRPIEPVLLCCLLFVAYETYQDENALAVQHLRFGRRAIGEVAAGSSRFSSKGTEKDVLAAFDWLGAQDLDFEKDESQRKEPSAKLTHPFTGPSISDLEYTKQALDYLSTASSNWRSELLTLAAEHVATLNISTQRPAILECVIHCVSHSLSLPPGHSLVQRHSQLLHAHQIWSLQLAALQRTRGHIHRRALLHLQIQLFYSSFILETARDTHAKYTDRFNDQAATVLDSIEEFLSPYRTYHGPNSSNKGVYPYTPLPQKQESCFSLEYAVVPTLLAICFKIRHSQTRRRALHLLRSANRREAGQWSGELCHYADAIIVLEESVAVGVVLENAKILEIVIEATGYLEVGLVCGRFRTEGDGMLEVVEYRGAGLPPLRLQLVRESVFPFGIEV